MSVKVITTDGSFGREWFAEITRLCNRWKIYRPVYESVDGLNAEN